MTTTTFHQDKWLTQQLQNFKDWANGILKRRDMAIVGLLNEDVTDGLAIINICEIVSGQSVGRYNKKPTFPGQKLDNIAVALRFIEKTWATPVYCTPKVIFEGNVQQVLGLFFLLQRIVASAPPPDTVPRTQSAPVIVVPENPPAIQETVHPESSKEESTHEDTISTDEPSQESRDNSPSTTPRNAQKEPLLHTIPEHTQTQETTTPNEDVQIKNPEEPDASNPTVEILTNDAPHTETPKESDPLATRSREHRHSTDKPRNPSKTSRPKKLSKSATTSEPSPKPPKLVPAGASSSPSTHKKRLNAEGTMTVGRKRGKEKSSPSSGRSVSEKHKTSTPGPKRHRIHSVADVQSKEFKETQGNFDEILKKCKKNPLLIARLQAVMRGKMERKYPHKVVKEYHRRRMIAKEIESTEIFYNSCLHYLLEGYRPALSNLKDDSGEPIVSAVAIKAIFSSTQVICSVSDKLTESLRKRMANWFTDECKIGNIFDKNMVGFLKVYISFVNSYDQATLTLRQISKNEIVKQEIERLRVAPDNPKSLNIDSLLIMPIQRLPRYVLLLQDLLAHTPSTHQDYPELSKAVESVVEVAAEVNLKKKTSDNVAAVALIRQKLTFSGMDNAVGLEKYFPNSASRIFISQGSLSYSEPEKNDSFKIKDISNLKLLTSQWKTYFGFLFNDCLIITSPVEVDNQQTGLLSGLKDIIWTKSEFKTWTTDELKDNNDVAFKYVTRVDLEGMEIIESYKDANRPISNELNTNAWALAKRGSATSNFLFSCVDDKARKTWITDLDSAIWGILKNKRSRVIQEKRTEAPKKGTVSHTGVLSVNYKGTPDDWVKQFGVIHGSNLHLYERENDFLSAVNPKRIEIPLDLVDVVIWPPQGVVTFLNLEKSEEYTDKEATLMQAFLARTTVSSPESPQSQDSKMLELINGQAGIAPTTKYYFSIEKMKPETPDGPMQTWYFRCTAQDVRMIWINKLRQAINSTLERAGATSKEKTPDTHDRVSPATFLPTSLKGIKK